MAGREDRLTTEGVCLDTAVDGDGGDPALGCHRDADMFGGVAGQVRNRSNGSTGTPRVRYRPRRQRGGD